MSESAADDLESRLIIEPSDGRLVVRLRPWEGSTMGPVQQRVLFGLVFGSGVVGSILTVLLGRFVFLLPVPGLLLVAYLVRRRRLHPPVRAVAARDGAIELLGAEDRVVRRFEAGTIDRLGVGKEAGYHTLWLQAGTERELLFSDLPERDAHRAHAALQPQL